MNTTFSIKNLQYRLTRPTTHLKKHLCINLPQSDRFEISACILNREQFFYDQYRRGEKTKNSFLNDINIYKIDTNALSKSYLKSYVHIFSGFKGHKKIISVDANNDYDFSNDIVYEFDTLNTNKWFKGDTIEFLPIIRLKYEVLETKSVQNKFSTIRLKPYDYSYKYPSGVDSQIKVYTINSEYNEGSFTVGGEEFKALVIANANGTLQNIANGYYYKIQKKEYEYKVGFFEKNDQDINVFGHAFRVISYESGSNTLKIRYGGKQLNPLGGFLNYSVPNIEGVDNQGKAIRIQKDLKDGRYVLLDFWGSWCAPCIKSLPSIKKLYDKLNSNRITFYGVDFEYDDDGRKAASQIIKKFAMDWEQISDTPSAKNKGFKLAESLSVRYYPTLILISPEGKVVFRETGENNIDKVEEYLSKIGLVKDKF